MKLNREHLYRLTLAAIGSGQGIVFWIAHRLWPEDPKAAALFAALVSLVTVFGLILELAWTGRNRTRLFTVAASVAALFALVTLWAWWQIPGKDALFQGDSFRLGTLAAASTLALYILLPYIQILHESGKPVFPYPELFRHSWNNFFIAGTGCLFAGIFWGLISLWVALFNMLGVSFFEKVFFSFPFVSITLSAMFGFGIALGKESQMVINTLLRVTLAIFRALMPLLAFIALLFLATLPFTGLQPLWNTKSASPLLLGVLLLVILFINALFQDGSGPRPYPGWLRRGVEGMLLVMPVFAGLTFYAIGLRISQYGLTPERFYVVLFAFITGLYGIGYAIGVVRQSGAWMGLMRPVNVGMSLLVAALALLVHTPVLDPLAWSAQSQYRRLVRGRVDAGLFDYGALRFQLGRAGHARLEALSRLGDHPQAEIIRREVERVRKAVSYYASKKIPPIPLADRLNVFTPSGSLPDGLVEALLDLYRYYLDECMKKGDCVVFSINVDNDPELEYAFVTSGEVYSIYLYDRDKELRWRRRGELRFQGGKRPLRAAMIEAIKKSKMKTVQPEYRDLKIADWVFSLRLD